MSGQTIAQTCAAPPSEWAQRQFDLPERLDLPCTFAEWDAAARQLARINRWTRAYAPAISLVQQVLERRGVGYEPLHVVDVGCGSGDTLRALHRWAAKRSVALRLTGVDLNPYAARAAREADRREHVAAKTIEWVAEDIFTAQLAQPADVIVNSLLAHHLRDADIVRLLRWQEEHARCAWLVSDLRRSERAHDVFARVSRWLRLHEFLQHDGPVSFRRALSVHEWQQMVTASGVQATVADVGMARLVVERVKL